MTESLKNVLWKVFGVAMVVICVVCLVLDDTEDIEDTNGADNYALQVITDQNIIKQDMGMVGGIKFTGTSSAMGSPSRRMTSPAFMRSCGTTMFCHRISALS